MSASGKRGKWRVMGRDTFAREDFVAAEFATQKEAEEYVRAKEAAVEKTQDEALRDEFWIVRPE